MRNYDTTNEQPFIYFDLLSVKKDPATQDVTIVYQDRWALKSGDDVTNFLDRPVQIRSMLLRAADMGKSVPVVDLSTGSALGPKMSYGQIMMGIVAAIRADQTAHDAADDAAAAQAGAGDAQQPAA